MRHKEIIKASVPIVFGGVVREVANLENTTVSTLVREAVKRLLLDLIPELLRRAPQSDSRIEMLRLVTSIRRAIQSDSAAGRHRDKRLRGYYMLYCNDHKRNHQNIDRLPFDRWLHSIDEITLTKPNAKPNPTKKTRKPRKPPDPSLVRMAQLRATLTAGRKTPA